MGRDKATLDCGGGETMLERMKALLVAAGCRKVTASGTNANGIPDAVPPSGPISGVCTVILSDAENHGVSGWLFVPTDMPALSSSLLRRLPNSGGEAAIFAGSPLPLFLRKTPAVIAAANAAAFRLRQGENLSLTSFLDKLELRREAASAPDQPSFLNVNTPEEWANFRKASHESAN